MSGVNSKRVFVVKPHVPAGFLDILGKREDVRLDFRRPAPDQHPGRPV